MKTGKYIVKVISANKGVSKGNTKSYFVANGHGSKTGQNFLAASLSGGIFSGSPSHRVFHLVLKICKIYSLTLYTILTLNATPPPPPEKSLLKTS